ncbi:laccase-7-like isoform X1 [Diospyros lotus]|uniref:laccase-7-like isoform X1 n=2 Tax=Diospyros lotus TaxID=55363 RepID=UPI00224C8EFC|nr:laccase-7-like isoform X1 [Diospyros lotus]
MAQAVFLLACGFALLASSIASAAHVEHYFHVRNATVRRLCQEQVITTVNGSLPGPTIQVREGDSLTVHVFNDCPYPLTIHWHGLHQRMNAWADGTENTTQCPIRPGTSFTYRMNITGQEGTLFWHAHSQALQETVHGAFIIRPRRGRSYPFPKPYREFPIIIGEWWNDSIIDVTNAALAKGKGPDHSKAFTFNGQPGALHPCNADSTYKMKVIQGKTYMLRIINSALNMQFFFKIAFHRFTVVAIDGSYTNPMETEVVVIAPGQTVDVLLNANQQLDSYYIAALNFISWDGVPHEYKAATGILAYEHALTSTPPLMPILPFQNDSSIAFTFHSNLTELVTGPHYVPFPQEVDEFMFVTVGMGVLPCPKNATCEGPLDKRLSGSMNNQSFQFPTKLSLLEAFYYNISGVYTSDFPDYPPLPFDFTLQDNNFNETLVLVKDSTRLKKLKFNSTVQIVFQNTALISYESHPMHMHGMDFYVLAQGFGNYDPVNDPKKFNLVNPQRRNTIAMPADGWVVIRFRANNPGTWLLHCHVEMHLLWGQSMVFEVENGPTPSTSLPPPPPDLPKCYNFESILDRTPSIITQSS